MEDDEPGKSDEGFVPQQPSDAAKTVIGKIVSSDGKADNMEQLIFMKPKPRVRKVKKKGNRSSRMKIGSYTMFLRIYQTKVLL